MRPLHICFVCSEYPPAPHGGIGSFTQTFARELVRRGHHVSVVGMYIDPCSEYSVDEGVHVYRVSRKGVPPINFIANRMRLDRMLQRIHAERPIDIAEGGEMDICMLQRSAPGIRVLRMHGGPTFFNTGIRIQVWKEAWALRVADELCAVSQCVGEGTREVLNLGDRHIEVIHNPIDTSLFAPAEDDQPEEDGLIVFTGTVTERKGIRQLIQAMPRIVESVPHARLEVYGGEAIDPVPPVPFQQTLEALLPSKVARHITWKGRVDRRELPVALQRASVCVYPSHIEAMPIGWLEGLAAGKAVVASETGPGPELIDHNETGLLCNPHDPDSIAASVIRLLQEPELRRKLGRQARAAAQERFNLDKIVEQNVAYYQRLIAEKEKAGR